MKPLALAAASTALIGLTACSHSSTPSGATMNDRAPVSCTKQYRSWTQGDGKGVMGLLHGVSSAAMARDSRVLATALERAKPAVATAARHPIPACADPRGYLNVLLMHVNAAAASKGSTSSVRAAVRDVPKIHRTLVAEVRKTAQ